MSVETSRRRFLRNSAFAAGALLFSAHLPRPLAAMAAAESTEPVVLAAGEWRCLKAITACIIPTDHQPGALEANCVNFIDKALANEDAAAVPLYRGGLAVVDVVAESRFKSPFAALKSDQQVELLRGMETDSIDPWPLGQELPAAMLFETMRMHTVIAFLSDPRYGGNQHFSGWKVVGYPGSEHHNGGYTRAQVEGKAKVVPVWDRGSH